MFLQRLTVFLVLVPHQRYAALHLSYHADKLQAGVLCQIQGT